MKEGVVNTLNYPVIQYFRTRGTNYETRIKFGKDSANARPKALILRSITCHTHVLHVSTASRDNRGGVVKAGA